MESVKPKSKLAFRELERPVVIEREDGRREQVKVRAYIIGVENVCGYGENKSFAAADLLIEKGVHRNAIVAFLTNNGLDTTGIDEFLLRKKTEIEVANTPIKAIEKPPKAEN